MTELLNELDFEDLPELDQLRWLRLERTAYARLLRHISDNDTSLSINDLKAHYMQTVETLASQYSVDNVKPIAGIAVHDAYDKFLLSVTRARTKIWASVESTNQNGTGKLSNPTKKRLLVLADEMEAQIEFEELTDARRKALHKILGNFRHEINQPKTRISVAISMVGQLSTIALVATAFTAQASSTYLNAIQILAAEQVKIIAPELVLLEAEEQKLLLGPPPKQIEGPKKGAN